jgi:hypothetical protein
MMHSKILPCLIGLTVVCIGIAPTAQCGCPEWHPSGKFTFIRSDGRKLTVGLLRHGERITGEAYYFENRRLHNGDAAGYLAGDEFNVTMTWQAGREIYEGRIDPQGHLSGTAYDEDHPDHRATWYAKELLHCASQ